MSPESLDQYLTVLKKHGVQSAKIELSQFGGGSNEGTIAVVFDVMPIPVGDTPEPGGWKAPTTLDAPIEPEVP